MGSEGDGLVAMECLRTADVVVEYPVPLAPELNPRLDGLVMAQYGGAEVAPQGMINIDGFHHRVEIWSHKVVVGLYKEEGSRREDGDTEGEPGPGGAAQPWHGDGLTNCWERCHNARQHALCRDRVSTENSSITTG